MSHDQCPTTTHGEKQQPAKAELAAVGRVPGRVNGLSVWRSLEEIADSPDFREHLEKEFPHGALEMHRAVENGGESRRHFLKIMGASMALAGVAAIPGCRQPDHKILPYSREVPEDVIPGKPIFFATSMPRPDGGAEGLLVETHEGRPTKIEGNPLHPISNGKCSTWALASIMSLYDPDRLKFPVYNNPARGKVEATWDDFRAWATAHFAAHPAGGGEGLAFVVGKASSPSLEAAKAAILARWPKARWVWYSPMEQSAAVEGARIAFGAPMREVLNLTKENTRVILSLDRDFLYHEEGEVSNARGFSRTREVYTTSDSMSRLYVVESGFTTTGSQADHRLRMAPSRVAAFAVEIAKFMLPMLGKGAAEQVAAALAAVGVPAGADIGAGSKGRAFLEACAKDLVDAANRGKAVVLAGHNQPAAIHALTYALNAALGSLGAAQVFTPLTADEAASSIDGLAGLVAAAADGGVKTLVVVNANPLYDAPGDLDLAGAWSRIGATITLSVGQSETADASLWSLNGAHYLESWGDSRAIDGTISPVQPMIAPLYDAPGKHAVLSELEFLTLLAGGDMTARVDGYEVVRANWRRLVGEAGFENTWRRALHNGVLDAVRPVKATPQINASSVVRSFEGLRIEGEPTAQNMDVLFVLGHPHDGRYGNIAWLHELPEVGTRTVWDNPALLSPATAEALGVLPVGYSKRDPSGIYTKIKYPEGRLADITIEGRTVRMPCWILPGMADNTVILTVGYGRDMCGKVGDGVGVNVYGLRGSAAARRGGRAARGASLVAAGGTYMIASTQNHWTMEGRALVRAVDFQAWQKHGDSVQHVVDKFYGTESTLNFAEQFGEKSHHPPILSIYKNPYNASDGAPTPGSQYATGQQWAMTIDQTLCNGCGTCTIACQSENNIPVVGKKEVAKGREMTWIRVDRYFAGEFDEPEHMLHQPVACVHCENAPCEVVCPVNATVHGPEGLNYMTYNRCIGTRYCANNCPYKVRRYNFFEYGKLAFNGDYIGKETLEKIVPERGGVNGSNRHNKININLIPPRLREKLNEIEQMQKNPDVTVRMRGVMEKCSYCVQRINQARIETRLQGLAGIPDGFFQAACQQACPSDAIVFGDMNDKSSRVHQTRANARSYALLGFLNTRPRTSHMLRVMNPNPALCSEARKASWDHPFHHGDDHGDGHGSHANGAHTTRFDQRKRDEDRGYALSLNVLGGDMA